MGCWHIDHSVYLILQIFNISGSIPHLNILFRYNYYLYSINKYPKIRGFGVYCKGLFLSFCCNRVILELGSRHSCWLLSPLSSRWPPSRTSSFFYFWWLFWRLRSGGLQIYPKRTYYLAYTQDHSLESSE